MLFFYKTSILNEEVNCTLPSPSASVPWTGMTIKPTLLWMQIPL